MSYNFPNALNKFRRKPLIAALEPRVLLDGAAVATTAAMVTDVDHQDSTSQDTTEAAVHFAAPAPTESNQRRELAFVDRGVEGSQALAEGLGDHVEVIYLEAESNGLAQIVAAVEGEQGINAIHILSHGGVGEVKLGSLTLNNDNLVANADLLSTLGDTLSESGDVLLYGCYVGADSEGQGFIDSLAELTRADVGASDDLTGAEGLGGDWVLEATSGSVETVALAATDYEGVLAPTVNAVADSVIYTEGGDPITIDAGINFSGGGDYREGYIRFNVDNPSAGDQFVLQDADDVNAAGAISVVGIDVYRGNGTDRERIGSIDSVENGLNGQPLKILLSSPLPNSGFEEGSKDWTLSSEVYGDNAGEINFDNFAMPLAEDTVYAGGTGTTNVQDPNNFNAQATISTGTGVDGTKALYLTSSGGIKAGDQLSPSGFKVDGYGSIHGPYATSTVISVENGDSISLDFKAVGSGDDYEVFGLLRRVDVNGDFVSDDPNDATKNVILFAERGEDTGGFVRVDKTGLSSGEYRFQFVGGTYDGTGGYAVGSNLYVDNIRLIPSQQVTDTIASKIASQVTYQSTADDTEVERDITISAMDSNGETGSDTITLKVEQRNNAPAFSGDGSLAAVNEDSLAPAGNTVGNLFDSLFADPDTSFTPADSLTGVVVTGDNSVSAEGEWQYSTDGSTWYAVGVVDNDNGLLLSRDASLRFVPSADYNGTPGGLSLHAVDNSDVGITFTDGASREWFDVTASGVTGGETAVSSSAVYLNTAITGVNDAPVMEAPAGGTVTDSEDYDDFADLTGALVATDIDSSSLTYGIEGGSDDGTYVTLAGTYGTLQVSKATGSYTFIPTSSAINGLNSTETQAFTVTVSDGELSKTQLLEFTLEGANDNPVFDADQVSTQVSVFSYPNLNGNDATPGQDNENANLASIVQWVINEGGDYTLDTAIQNFTDADFADKLYSSGFFFMTDMESGDPNSESFLPESAKSDIRSWVDAGGVIMMTGTAGQHDTDFLNAIFNWDLTTERGSSWELNETNALGTPFEGGPASLSAPSATDSIGRGSVEGFNAIYGDETNATVATIGYGAGTVIFMGYDYYNSGIAGTGFTDTATQYGEDVSDGGTRNDGWVREIIPRSLQYSADLSSDTLLVESDSALSSSGALKVSDVDQPDTVTVSVSGVTAEQLGSDGVAVVSDERQPTIAELLAMLDTGSQPSIDASATSGDVSWTFNSNGEAFDYLSAGESLVLSYELTADDANGGIATRVLSITINGTNDVPVLEQPAPQDIDDTDQLDAFTDLIDTLDASDIDIGQGNLTFSIEGGDSLAGEASLAGAYGTLRLDEVTGEYTYTPDSSAIDLLTSAESESFTVTVSDGTTTVSKFLTFNINGVNDLPVLDQPASQQIDDTDQLDTFSEVTGTLAASDIETDQEDLRFGIEGGESLVEDVSLLGAYGTLKVIKATGEYTYTPDSAAINALTSAEVESFAVTVTDGSDTVTKTLTFNINGANDVPVIGTVSEVDDTTTPPDLSGGGNPGDGAEVLDNGLLRFGSNAQDSINAVTGMLEQPFYYDDGQEFKLTYSSYALNMALGVNGDGANDWNLNGDVDLAPRFSNITVDTSGFSDGSGTLVWRGEITINGAQLAVSHVYELPADSAYIETRTYLTNIGTADATNLRVWVGTQDDYIAGSDRPAKQKGNLVGGAFEVNTSKTEQGQAIKVYSEDTAVLFFSTSDKANTIIGQHYGWTLTDPEDTPAIDPSESQYEQPSDDGGYAMFVRMDDLAAGETQSFDWFYAAGSTQQIDAIIADVSAAASANLIEGSGQLIETGEFFVSDVDAGDIVTVAASEVSAGRTNADGDSISLGSEIPDHDTLLAMLSVTPSTVVDAESTSGQFSWNFDAGSEGFDFLRQGETLTLSYTLTAEDSFGATATQVVDVVIEGINNAPVTQDASESVDENTIFNGSADASDVDGAIAGFELISDVASGSLTFNQDGSYSFDPGSDFDDLAVGETRPAVFTYRAIDNSGAVSRVATITLNVTGNNDVPVVSSDSEAIQENGQIVAIVPSASDVDGTVVGYQLESDVSSGSLAFHSNGSYTFETGSEFDDLAVGEIRQVSFTYSAIDDQGGVSEPGTVTFTVLGTNDLPVISVDTSEAITEVPGDSSNQNLSDAGTITFSDVDTTDTVDITFEENGDIAWTGGALTDAQKGALIGGFSVPSTNGVATPGRVDWTYSLGAVDLDFLAPGETLSFSYTVTATDSQGATATDTVTFTITGTNDAPTIRAEAAEAITEAPGDASAQALSDSGAITFGDLDTTDLVDITFASNNDIAWSGATASEPLNADLAASLVNGFSIPATNEAAAPGGVDWSYSLNDVDLDFLAAGETLTFSYTVIATDSQGATATDTVTFTITGTNDAPTIAAEKAAPITEVGGDSSTQTLSDNGVVTFGDLDTTDLVDITFEENGDIAWTGGTLTDAQTSALIGGFSIPATAHADAPGSVDWA